MSGRPSEAERRMLWRLPKPNAGSAAVLVDELNAGGRLCRNSQIEAVRSSNREQKLGSFCESAIGIWLLLLFGR
jgi:hypothetical protein